MQRGAGSAGTGRDGFPGIGKRGCGSEPEELNGEAGDADGGAGEGVGVAFEGAERHEADAPAGGEHHGHHGADGGEGKDTGDEQHTPSAVFGGGVHDQWNQRFTGAEHKDGEEDPGGDMAGFEAVRVGMFAGVYVLMGVDFAVPVNVGVDMGFVFGGAVEAPYRIGEAEDDEQLGGEVAAPGFEPFQFAQGNAERRADEPEGNGADDVAEAAEEGDAHGFADGPVACFAHDDEGQIVVGPGEGVAESDQGGGAG